MDKHTLESIRRIKEASKNGKLVMFIGAGVSALSGYPNWGELIEKLDLSNEKKSYYSDEDYLTIPQKYYNSRGHKEYYDVIKQTFDVELEPNFIHDEIFRLDPTHIITTNYDNLIEKSITKKGLFYDVISRDRDVANTKSKNFIIKMHGEIKNENIVLKEEDFINYDNNFKLIETMVKSIIASNLVVFVGYSIKEFNVKKILSWVKELQGDSFQPSYWLYIGSPRQAEDRITKENYDYYKGRGINIIDYNDLKEGIEKLDSYEDRYRLVLESISNYEKYNKVENHKGIDYLYSQLLPLNELNRIRRKDIADKIGDNYIIDNIGNIDIYNINDENKLNSIEEFNLIHKKVANGEEIDYDEEKYNLICNILKKSNIVSYFNRNKNERLIYKFNNKLENTDYYNFDYFNMDKNILKINQHIKDDYIKAFNLYKFKMYKEAYNLYSNIGVRAFEQKNYLFYYLSQVNRYWVGKLIKQNSFRFDKLFVNKVKMDIEHTDLSNLFNSLPKTFRNNFNSLEDIGNYKIIHSNLYHILDVSKKVNENRESNCIEMGITKLDKLLYSTQEMIEFFNKNYIVYDDSSEFKLILTNYVMTILSEYSTKFNERLALNYTAEFFGIENSRGHIQIDYMDIVIMVRYIDNKQLKSMFNKFNIVNLEFDEVSKLLSLLDNIYYGLNSIRNVNSYLRMNFINELENIVFLLRYIKLSTDEYIKVISIISKLKETDLSMSDKIQFLDKQELYNSNKDLKIIQVLDEWLYNEFSSHIILQNKEYNNYERIGVYIHEKDNNYICKLDNLIKSQIIYLDKERLSNIISLTCILSQETIRHLKERINEILNSDFDFQLLNKSIIYNLIKDGDNFIEEIYEYIKSLEQSRTPGIIVYPDKFEDDLETLGILIFNDKIDGTRFLEFTEYSDKLSFLININKFDYSKFKHSWILEYNKHFHKALAKTKAGIKVKCILEEYIRNGQTDQNVLELYFDIYKDLKVERHKKIRRRFIK